MDDDLDTVAVEPLPDRVGSVQVELRAAPRERPARTGVGRLAERADEGSPEPARGTRDGDAHPQSEPARGDAVAQPVPVLALVVGVPVVVTRRPPPRLVLAVPVDGRGKALVERHGRRPAEGRELGAVHRVAPVVAGPVLHLADQAPRFAQLLEQPLDRVAVRQLGPARDVVRLARSTVPEHEIDRRGVVADVQPVPPLEAVAVERQRPVVERVRDEQRDELLGVVEGAVRVRATGDHRVDAVGDVIAPREQLTGRLRGGVRRARVERMRPRLRAPRRSSRTPRPSRPGRSGSSGPGGPAPGPPRAGCGRR